MQKASCPRGDELREMIEGRLGRARQEAIEAHVEACEACQESLERLTSGRRWSLAGRTTERVADDSIATGSFDGGRPTSEADLEATEPQAGETQEDATSPGPGPGPGPVLGPAGCGEPRWPRLPGYELRNKLGEGGMGVVYLARQVGLNRDVAIKMIRGGGQARPEHFARFRIEAEAVAQLRHRHIVQIHDIGEADGLPFVSLELLSGGSLDDRLGGTPRPGLGTAELMMTLADAVRVAHEAGIVHRDLKPSNILFDLDGVPRVTDFGLAKRLESDSNQTESGAIMGSPSYMAPEQARGHTKDVGPAVDVYALGAILYEMLTGRPPFKGETAIETVRQVVEDEVIPPSRLVPKVPRDLETICLKCLEKDASRRYDSAKLLGEDLGRYVRGEPIRARRTSVPLRLAKWARRRPAVAALFLVGLTSAVGLGSWGVIRREQRVAEHLREMDRKVSLTDRGSHLRDAAREATSPDDLGRLQSELSAFIGELGGDAGRLVPGLKDDVARSLGDVERKQDQERQRQVRREADAGDRRRYDEFRQLRARAQLNAGEYTLNSAGARSNLLEPVRRALVLYARDPKAGDAAWDLAAPLPDALSDAERASVRGGCYDLLLALSQGLPPAEGLKVLDRAAALHPEPTAAYHLRRADCLAGLGDREGSRREQELAAQRPPVTALDHFLIGRERLVARRWDEAVDALEKAVSLDADLTASHLLLAVCHFAAQPRRLGEALGSIDRGLKSHPDLVGLYLLRALIHGEQGNQLLGQAADRSSEARGSRRRATALFDEAEKDYRQADSRISSDDSRYVLLVNRGGMRLQAGKLDASAADLKAAIRLRPGPYQAYTTLAQLHRAQGKLDESSRDFSMAIERAPDSTTRLALHRTRARLHSGRRDASPGQRAEALKDLEDSIRLGRGDRAGLAEDQVERARLLFASGRPSESLAAAEAAVELAPSHPEAHNLRISSLLALRRYDAVLASCDAYLAREQPTLDILEIRGLARFARRDFPGAISDCTRAVELRSDLAPAPRSRLLNQRGWAYHMADAPRLALEDFETSLKLVAGQADAHAGRGLARVRLGDWKAAVADAEDAVRLAGAPTLGEGEDSIEVRRQARFNAARIYAQATELAAAAVGREGERAVRLYRQYRVRALDHLDRSLQGVPAAERAALLSDPALQPLHRGRTMAGSVNR
ncbi:serine/threonine-protein kinase [Aquisphaera insulae]|uniref:serine/threonine-protein kinase n=1 Tax=Aquisphaera insulae TaxID=2712864 RepID=UPI0013EC0D17|nr:serine/threonine-protein kinase [Aquisphaera insulae]